MKENTRTCPISGRIAEEDYEFLMQHSIAGKVTASEKLRHIAAFYRQYHESMRTYSECLAEIQRLLGPFRRDLKALENANAKHSELLDRITTAVPELLAFLITSEPPADAPSSPAYLTGVEERVCRMTLSLLESIMRMGLTRESPTYNPHLLRSKLSTILELADLLAKQPAS